MVSYSENAQDLSMNGFNRSVDMALPSSFTDFRDGSMDRTVLRGPSATLDQASLWTDRSSRAAPLLTQDGRMLSGADSLMMRLPSPQLAQNPLIHASRSMPQIIPPLYGQANARGISPDAKASVSPAARSAVPPIVRGQPSIMADNQRRTWPHQLRQSLHIGVCSEMSHTPRAPVELIASGSATEARSYPLNHSGSVGSAGVSLSSMSPPRPTSVQVPTPALFGTSSSSSAQLPTMQVLEARFKDIVEHHVQDLLSTLEASIEQHHTDLFARMEQMEVRCSQQSSLKKDGDLLALHKRVEDLAKELEKSSYARQATDSCSNFAQQAEVEEVRENQCQASVILSGLQQRIEELQQKCEALQSAVDYEMKTVRAELQTSIVDTRLAVERKVESTDENLSALRADMRTDLFKDLVREVRAELQADIQENVRRNVAVVHSSVGPSATDVQDTVAQSVAELTQSMADVRAEVERRVSEVRVEVSRRLSESGLRDIYDVVMQVKADIQRHDAELGSLRHAGSDQGRNQTAMIAELKDVGTELKQELRADLQTRLREVGHELKQELQAELQTSSSQSAARLEAHQIEIAKLSEVAASLQSQIETPPSRKSTSDEWVDAQLPLRRSATTGKRSLTEEPRAASKTEDAPPRSILRRGVTLPSPQRKTALRLGGEEDMEETPADIFLRLFVDLSLRIGKDVGMTAQERESLRKRARSIASLRGHMDFETEELMFDGEAPILTPTSAAWAKEESGDIRESLQGQ